MFSKDLELALIKAIKEAKQHRHEYVTVEHMLYGLLHDELAHVGQGDVGRELRVIQPAVGVFLDDARLGGEGLNGRCGHDSGCL